MAMKRLYEYCIIYNPKEGSEEKPSIIVPLTQFLASSDGEARLMVNRVIPEEYMDKLETITAYCRGFLGN